MEHIGLYLRDIYLQNKRGQLIFVKGHIHKYLFFKDGYLIFAKTNQKDELLGEILYRLGKLSEGSYSKIDEFIEPGKNIGTALVDNKLLSKESLQEGLSLQMKEITLNVFPLFDGRFTFREKEDFAKQKFEWKLSIPSLIQEGIRHMDYHSELREFMKQKVLRPKKSGFVGDLKENEKELWSMIKQGSTPEEMFDSSGLEPEFFWKGLYLFYCLDLIEMEAEEKIIEPSEVEKAKSPLDQKKRLEEFKKFSTEIPEMNYYQILGVSRSASPGEIKIAYFHLARKFHPDILSRDLPADAKSKIDGVFAVITKAYNTLRDGKRREDYDDQLDSPREEKRKDVTRQAEVKFRQGKTLYDQGRFEESLLYLEQAVRLWQGKASYFLLLAMAQAKLPEYRKKAEKNFLKAIELESWNPDSFIALGLMYKKEGLHFKAKKQFERALQIDPGHKIALKELKLTGKKKKGLRDYLSIDIFGKKKR